MKQVVQPASGGEVRVLDVPRPIIGPAEVLVRTLASLMSPGTERAVTDLAQSSLVAKARARPDLVRQVVRKARTDGLSATARAVRARLDQDVPLGYSAAGIAVEVGEAVAGIVPGQLVATGGAGRASHAEYQAVPGLLCAPVPEGVAVEDAAFATLASVALHGLRLADVAPGSKVVVVGLGLLGQLAVRLARASGCDVAGIDIAEGPVALAASSGAFAQREAGEDTTDAILRWSRDRGADAVLLTAATPSSETIRRTPALCRDRATVVVVGDVGLELDRRPFYDRELTIRFARSYGPGRYERSYEEWAVDYPPGFVRWTEGRNMEAVLDLLAGGHLAVRDLVTHRFPIESATAAYELVRTRAEPFVGITFTYREDAVPDGPVEVAPRRSRPPAGEPGVGLVGAGAFARTVLLPALADAGFGRLVAVCSASGLSARSLAERGGFEKAVSGPDALLADPDVGVVVIATAHASHADLAARALEAGKDVFCEKPLALTVDELERVEAAWRESGRVLFVGFNRRWSEAVVRLRERLVPRTGPLVTTYRVNAGPVPPGHWYGDRREGGRLLGEVCHFVDTCSALAGQPAARAVALGSGPGELLLADDVVVGLRHPDGSLATISYASGGRRSDEKERLEVLGGGHSATIVDFRRLMFDGEDVRLARPDKGHAAQMEAFWRAVAGDTETGRGAGASAISSMRVVLQAAAALRGGELADG